MSRAAQRVHWCRAILRARYSPREGAPMAKKKGKKKDKKKGKKKGKKKK
ncbi:MAG: hypothetical protein ABW033_07425 [Acidimicrobiia bacterium]